MSRPVERPRVESHELLLPTENLSAPIVLVDTRICLAQYIIIKHLAPNPLVKVLLYWAAIEFTSAH